MKTFQELGITELEHTSLIKVLELLKSGALKHRPNDASGLDIPMAFNMGVTADQGDCGSVCCIGGWTSVFMQGSQTDKNGLYLYDDHLADRYVMEAQGALEKLFFPPQTEDGYEAITEVMAAEALENYLHTGDAEWESILPEGSILLDDE